MRDDKFNTTAGIVNLHPTKGAHWVMISNQFFCSYGFAPPVNITQQNKRGIFSENQIQKKDSCCAAYCLLRIFKQIKSKNCPNFKWETM